MKLKSFRIREFRSIHDTGVIDVDNITCLVGKNEAGKTAILQALYRLNPVVDVEGDFDVTIDYPRRDVGDYKNDVEVGKREHAKVVESTYLLDEEEKSKIRNIFGVKALKNECLHLSKDYDNNIDINLEIDDVAALQYLTKTADLTEQLKSRLVATESWSEAQTILHGEEESTTEVKRLQSIVDACVEDSTEIYIWNQVIEERVPNFLYFDEYYQMEGRENVNALLDRRQKGNLKKSDYPLLGFLGLARLNLEELIQEQRTVALKTELESAGNYLTQRILKYWTQNKHIQLKFDLRPGLQGDPEGMTSGMNILGEVYNKIHGATTELSSRSKGFLWFFSFLAWYEDEKKKSNNLILLLDEPGLSLHGRAQGDLLRYIEQELASDHQIIYTTHSPFMVDSNHFDRVRIVQDLSMDSEEPFLEDGNKVGTTIINDVFAASDESLFPLQGALGYDIHQTLFVGPNTLIVEGASDLLYLQNMSTLLERLGEGGLDSRWTITPVGGSGKVSTFVALLGAQKNINLAVLLDIKSADQQMVQNLYKKKLLEKSCVFTYADFVDATEVDIEDLFERKTYLGWVNAEFDIKTPIKVGDLNSDSPRILMALEDYLKKNPLKNGQFSHYRPARYFSDNFVKQSNKIDRATKERFKVLFSKINNLLK